MNYTQLGEFFEWIFIFLERLKCRKNDWLILNQAKIFGIHSMI